MAPLERPTKSKKISLAMVVMFACRGGAAELSFPDQTIALPRLSLAAQSLASRPLAQSVPKEVERLANAEFRRRFGLCGMFHLVERSGDAWTFSTQIGYSGMPGPDFTVFSKIVRSADPKPRQAPEMSATGRGSS